MKAPRALKRAYWTMRRMTKLRRPHDALDNYSNQAPSPQGTVDIFKGEWSSALPGYQSGGAGLFDDPRIHWGAEQFGGFKDRSVLDMGPLEGGHPYMFEKGGAAEIVSVEANSRAYLKCLLTQKLYNLQRVNYLYGDMLRYLEACDRRFDLVNASGVLYHQTNPVELIAKLAKITDRVLMWTHYYDEAGLKSKEDNAHRVSPPDTLTYEGYSYTAHRQKYGGATGWGGFCGGGNAYSYWMPREEVLKAFKHFGFGDVRVSFETAEGNGPSFNLAAIKQA